MQGYRSCSLRVEKFGHRDHGENESLILKFLVRSVAISIPHLVGVNYLFFVVKTTTCQSISLITGGKLIDELVNRTIHHGRQIVTGYTDAVICHAVLWIVIRADLFGPFTSSHL